MPKREHRSNAEWQDIIERQEQSGLTGVAFCLQEGIYAGQSMFFVSETLSYFALTGLVAAMIWMTIENRRRASCVASVD